MVLIQEELREARASSATSPSSEGATVLESSPSRRRSTARRKAWSIFWRRKVAATRRLSCRASVLDGGRGMDLSRRPREGRSAGLYSLGTQRTCIEQPLNKARAQISRQVRFVLKFFPRPLESASVRPKLSHKQTICAPRLTEDLNKWRIPSTSACPSSLMMSSFFDHRPATRTDHSEKSCTYSTGTC